MDTLILICLTGIVLFIGSAILRLLLIVGLDVLDDCGLDDLNL